MKILTKIEKQVVGKKVLLGESFARGLLLTIFLETQSKNFLHFLLVEDGGGSNEHRS